MNHNQRSDAPRTAKWWWLAIISIVIASYVAGMFTHAFLPANEAARSPTPAQGSVLPRETTEEDEYQRIAQELVSLTDRTRDRTLKATLTDLADQVAKLKTLNPYYRFKEIKKQTIPSGAPDIYGQELGVSFDRVQESILILGAFDPTYGKNKIILSGQELERYINVGSQIACKYCCEAQTLVFADGRAACGCDHSQAMRGLAAYLIKNHAQDYDDAQVLNELHNWRAAFFPKQTLIATLQEKLEAGEAGINEIMKEFPEFLPGMVGGC